MHLLSAHKDYIGTHSFTQDSGQQSAHEKRIARAAAEALCINNLYTNYFSGPHSISSVKIICTGRASK